MLIPGQGVRINYAAIIEILIQQLDRERGLGYVNPEPLHLTFRTEDEIQQSTALRWLAEFLTWAHEVMIPFTPRLIPCILPNLAHHVQMIQSVAVKTNKLLFDVIKSLPSPADQAQKAASIVTTTTTTSTRAEKIGTPPPSSRLPHSPMPAGNNAPANAPSASVPSNPTRSGVSPDSAAQLASGTRPPSPVESTGTSGQPQTQEEADPFDYQLTVNELTVQFLSEWEETRVTTLQWLIMLHQKAPRKVMQTLIIELGTEFFLIDPVYGRWDVPSTSENSE